MNKLYFRISLALLLYFILFPSILPAQPLPPKREFRGVWIATVANIDWPSKKGLSSPTQQQEFQSLLDKHQKNGINAVFVQVRPSSDAFYRSRFELWSLWLTGKQGAEPTPFYDPLSFMIEESHKRNIEFHAWFNPYRATFDTISANVSPTHITFQKPDWFLTYGGKKLFNPGLPQVRDYITQVIMDVVKNYDLDGVHFDDYFYPYAVANDTLRDDSTFVYFANGIVSKEDWRRENVNKLIQMVSDSIQRVKPHVKFGISPFGIWRNKTEDPQGSDTRSGVPSYSHLYADSREWLRKQWIDYIAPQLYFSIGYPPASYEKLLDWWSNNSFGRHLYIGQAPYKINSNADTRWTNPSEMPNQLRLNRTNKVVQGSIYFSSKSLLNNPNHIADSLQKDFYRYPALVPTMPWKDKIPPLPPQKVSAASTKSGIYLSWSPPVKASDGDTAYYYVIYRFNKGEAIQTENSRAILAFHRPKEAGYWDKSVERKKRYVYVVTATDRLHNESGISNVMKVKAKRRMSDRVNE